MTGGKSGRVSGINFGRAARRSATANDIDDVLGTEAGKFHDGPGNIARRIAARQKGIAARPGCYGGADAAEVHDGPSNLARGIAAASRETDSSAVRWKEKFVCYGSTNAAADSSTV